MSDKEIEQTRYEKFIVWYFTIGYRLGVIITGGITFFCSYIWCICRIRLSVWARARMASIADPGNDRVRCIVVAVGTCNFICRDDNLVDGSLTGSPKRAG